MKTLLAPLLIATLSVIPLHADDETAAAPAAETTTSAATPAPTPQSNDKKPVDMFEFLDYDDGPDVFYAPGTKNPYSGPVYSTNDGGGKESEGFLKEGHEEGWWIEYYDNGNISMQGLYKVGNEDGWWTYYHENGAVESSGRFENGIPVGKWVAFFPSGKPDYVGQYVDGVMDGDWTFYDENTGKTRVIKFDKGTQLTQ